MTRTGPGALEQLVAAREVLVVCGPGGVGKTTTAAALGLGAVRVGAGRVLVLTVDPARRLADALGIELGAEPVRVEVAHAPARRDGELFAAMLDPRAAWDALVEHAAPSPAEAAEILANPFYVNLTQRFALSNEYIAMARLDELQRSGEWDLIVVDTPPSQNALDFLDAPERLGEFFDSSLLRWIVAPRRSRLVDLAARPFYQVADRVLGTQLLADLSRFFVLFNALRDPLLLGARQVAQRLRSPGSAFVVVSTLEPAPVLEAQRLQHELARRGLPLGLLVANRALPDFLGDPGLRALASDLDDRAGDLSVALCEAAVARSAPELVEAVLREVARSYGDYRHVANRNAEALEQLRAGHELCAVVTERDAEASALEGLAAFADELFAAESSRGAAT